MKKVEKCAIGRVEKMSITCTLFYLDNGSGLAECQPEFAQRQVYMGRGRPAGAGSTIQPRSPFWKYSPKAAITAVMSKTKISCKKPARRRKSKRSKEDTEEKSPAVASVPFMVEDDHDEDYADEGVDEMQEQPDMDTGCEWRSVTAARTLNGSLTRASN
jgi:hypothetical protein